MNALLEYFASEGWSRLVMGLIHSLWQGGIIAAGLWLVLRRLPARQTNARYAAALASLALLVLGVLITGSILGVRDTAKAARQLATSNQASAQRSMPEISLTAAQTQQTPAAAGKAASANDKGFDFYANAVPVPAHSVWAAWAAMLWLAGCGTMSVRLLAQWLDLQRITSPCLPVADVAIQNVLHRLQKIIGVRQDIRILSGNPIAGPSVYGIIAPKLLLPPALLLGVPVEQLEAIIAHELAHIRRHDYLVNLAQQIVEAALFFNPAVWWINRQIRIEREACCDRMAVEATGNTESYAWSLHTWTERQRESALALASAFGSEKNPGGPLERLKRLLISEYRPSIRLPWHSLLGMMLIGGVLFFGLCQGTRFAVGYAAELLTPAQRIEKMAEIWKELGQQEYDYGTTPPISKQVLISGTIETQDKTPVDSHIPINIVSKIRRYSTSLEITAINGRFEYRVPPGNIWIAVSASGFAPALLGPIEAAPGSTNDTIKVVLAPGYTSRIQFADASGKPVSGAEVEYWYSHPAQASGKAVSGPDGVAVLTNMVAKPIRTQVTAHGFEYEERELPSAPDGTPYAWQLERAAITLGTVLSEATGRPIADATVRLSIRDGKFPTGSGSPDYATVLATTDQEGRFKLDTLNADATYSFFILSPGHAVLTLQDIKAGQSITAKLKPQIDIKGKVLGDLSAIADGKLEAKLSWSIPMGRDSTHSHGRKASIQIRDGAGHFEFTNTYPGPLELTIGGFHTNLNVLKTIDSLVIDLNPQPSSGAPALDKLVSRDVVLKARVPKDHPPVTGSLKYNCWSDLTHRGEYRLSSATNGEIRVSIPVPGGISLDSIALSTYWIQQLYTNIPPGPQPFEIEIEAIPSGVIYGKVVDSDGSDVSDMMVDVLEASPSPLKRQNGSLGVTAKNSSSTDDGPTRFSAQPLPLGGRYIILAHRRNQYAASEPIKLTAEKSIREITVKLATGVPLKGKVLDETGQPVLRATVALTFDSSHSHSFGGQGQLTDRNGEFIFDRFNPDAPGTYWVEVKDVPGHQPMSHKVKGKTLPPLRLKKGVALEGTVLDHGSGKPIPNAKVVAMPEFSPVERRVSVETHTDAQGRFHFTSLAAAPYRLLVPDTEPPTLQAQGGQTKPVILRVKPYSWSKLRPAE